MFQNTIAERWPEEFGGLWMDVEDFAVVVAFTAEAEARVDELRGEFPYPDELRPRSVEVSLTGLERIHGRMIRERAELSRGRAPAGMPAEMRETRGRWDLDIDVKGNVLVVQVDEPSEKLRTQFRDRFSPTIVMGKRGGGQSCGPLDCRYKGIGGLRLNKGTSSSVHASLYCSSGFDSL